MSVILGIFTQLNIKHFYILLLLLTYLIASILFYKKVFNDPELKKFFLDSLRESNTGKASGKSLTAFLLSNIIAIATIVALIYSPSHILPEFFLISILTFIASLYGISFALASKNISSNQQPISYITETEEEKKKKEEEEKKKNNPDDVG